MNCKWCELELSKKQVYQFLLGKSKGTSCSSKCSMMILNWKDKKNYIEKHKSICVVCEKEFIRKTFSGGKVCSTKCQGVLSSNRMKIKNPMFIDENRKKVSDKQKEIKHKPFLRGGNGRGATIYQLQLYNELIKYNDSFEMELIELTRPYTNEFKAPRHYKIDIGSRLYKIAIEVDGSSHNSLKVKECDERKTKLLNLKGWKVLRLSNLAIQNELENCAQKVLSMI